MTKRKKYHPVFKIIIFKDFNKKKIFDIFYLVFYNLIGVFFCFHVKNLQIWLMLIN